MSYDLENFYDLRSPVSNEDWSSYHRIRKEVLFSNLPYDKNHPDEFKEGNTPLILVFNHKIIGTSRMDKRDSETAIMRLVAIDKKHQRNGHGSALHKFFVKKAKAYGFKKIFIHSHPSAIGFYKCLGWVDFLWDIEGLHGIPEDRQMSLDIASK